MLGYNQLDLNTLCGLKIDRNFCMFPSAYIRTFECEKKILNYKTCKILAKYRNIYIQ